MKPDWARVAGMAGILATGIFAVLFWKPVAPRETGTPPVWTPWIGLPAIDDRMSSQDARVAMFEVERAEESGGARYYGDTLIGQCGKSFGDWQGSERYVVNMAESAFSGAKSWRIEMDVEGDQVKARVEYASNVVAPPPLRVPGTRTAAPPRTSPPRTIALPKASLQPIADAWRGERGWNAPQQPLECMDGRPLVLEACVHGRYAMRKLQCDALGSGDRLWRELHRRLVLDADDSPSPKK